LRGGKAKFDQSPGDPYACRFQLTRVSAKSWTIDNEDAQSLCGGLGVYFAGDYRAS
jgi:hypothetical protein